MGGKEENGRAGGKGRGPRMGREGGAHAGQAEGLGLWVGAGMGRAGSGVGR